MGSRFANAADSPACGVWRSHSADWSESFCGVGIGLRTLRGAIVIVLLPGGPCYWFSRPDAHAILVHLGSLESVIGQPSDECPSGAAIRALKIQPNPLFPCYTLDSFPKCLYILRWRCKGNFRDVLHRILRTKHGMSRLRMNKKPWLASGEDYRNTMDIKHADLNLSTITTSPLVSQILSDPQC